MTATGTYAVAGNQDAGKFRYADDMISLPLQCGTQWDALGHIFYGDKMWNGYDARLVDSDGTRKNAIDKIADDGVYEFFFCAPPLPITGGCGSPLNPIAIK